MNWWGPCLVMAAALAIVWRGGPRPPAVSLVDLRRRLLPVATARPRQALACAVGGTMAVALIAGGPVAAIVAAVYAGLAGRALIRRSARRRAAANRAAALDLLAALAADLRAGLPPAEMSVGRSQAVEAVAGAERLSRLTAAVWQLAERTGAPVADLVEGIEADARAADRAAAHANAQAAGAQATAMLLAALPIGGIGLGLLIGADPLYVLLRTPLGGVCAVTAVLLQGAGLLWAERLVGQ
ncbi:hypothetical protein [Paractinoplanes atraurantiacus]|uniref:Tight adherence protein B n=1 Tax=Paractinoplanes atraurantiacus TaxID=1036182 RepID=A0A285KE71_9ACTN|nr:hypothetical protein [Actinoplanes atraurantiacus]SNY70902.1 tight adherence protein B [Actinoplanes atraurantiacus]